MRPFGLLWWAREVEVPLPRPLHVAPRPATPGAPRPRPDDAGRRVAPAGALRGRRAPGRAPVPGRGLPPVGPLAGHLPHRHPHGPRGERQTDEPVVDRGRAARGPCGGRGRVRAGDGRGRRAACSRGRPVVLGTLEADGRVRAAWCGTGSTSAGAWPGPCRATPAPAGRPSGRTARSTMTLWQRVVQANRPGPPEHSVPFRVASAATVVIAIGRVLEPGRAGAGGGPVRRGGHGRGQRPLLLAAGTAVAGGQAHPGRLRRRRVRVVHRHGEPHRHPRGHLHGRGPAGRAVRLGAVHPRLRRPGPPGRRLLAGRLGRPDGRGRGPVGRPHPRASTWWPGWPAAVGAGGHVAVHGGGPRASRGGRWAPAWWRGRWWPSCWSRSCPPRRCRPRSIFPSSSANSSPVDSPEQPDRRLGVPARPSRQPQRAAPGWAASWASPSRSTPAPGRARATRWSCGCGPAGPASGSGQTYDTGTARAGSRPEPGQRASGPSWTAGRPSRSPPARTRRRPWPPGTTDVQTFYLAQSGPEPGVPRRQRPRVYIQSRSLFLTGDGTIVSASRWARAPSTPWCPTTSPPRPSSCAQPRLPGTDAAGRRPPDPVPTPTSGRYLQLPTPTPGSQALARAITAGSAPRATPTPTPTTRSRPSRRGCPATSGTPPTSRRWPPGPTP